MDTHHLMPLKTLSGFFMLITLAVLFSCNNKSTLVEVDPAFSKYIDAYTSGVVSKKNTLRIQLAEDAGVTHTLNETVKETLFSLSPAVDGKAYWIDARTVEFRPDKDLQPDVLYEVSFALNKVMDVPDTYKNFRFNIQTLKPSFEVENNGLRSNGKELMSLSGQIVTADVEESAKN